MPYSPLGKGFLTGKIDASATFEKTDLRARIPRFAKQALQHNVAIVGVLRRIAERKGTTPAQLALAWLLARKPWIAPIPGTTKFARLDENIGAFAVELTAEDLGEIERGTSRLKAPGIQKSSSKRPAAELTARP